MSIIQKLVSRGMFPKELPPNFTSQKFADALPISSPPFTNYTKWLGLARHSLARPSGVRRILSIPNPIVHYRLSAEIASHWTLIQKHFKRSKWSKSLPTLRPTNQRAVGAKLSGDETVYEKARCRASARYLLKADIAEFYRSVYTHSIPWALQGKAYVKSVLPNTTRLWSNALDKITQQGQAGQTNGIPIGPDTSFILGEVILSAIDVELQQKLKFAHGYRFYDDYEIAVSTKGEAEIALNTLQDELAKYDLQLNAAKTKIIQLPYVANDSLHWVKAFPNSLREAHLGDELNEFYQRVFEHHHLDPSSQIITFAISRMSERAWSGKNWELAQDLMSQAVVSDTGAMQQYVGTLVRLLVNKNVRPDPNRLAGCLSQIILHHAPRGHGSEVAWALWACMVFNLKLSKACAQAISAMEDDIVALLALELNSQSGFATRLDTTIWSNWMAASQLTDEHWLLAYEAYERNWLPSHNGSDYIASDTNFNWLRSHGIRFTKNFRRPTRSTLREIRLSHHGYDVDDSDNPDDDLPF